VPDPQRIQMKPPGGDAAITAIPDHIFVTGYDSQRTAGILA